MLADTNLLKQIETREFYMRSEGAAVKLVPATWRGTGLGALVGTRDIHSYPWAPGPVPLQLNSTLHSHPRRSYLDGLRPHLTIPTQSRDFVALREGWKSDNISSRVEVGHPRSQPQRFNYTETSGQTSLRLPLRDIQLHRCSAAETLKGREPLP